MEKRIQTHTKNTPRRRPRGTAGRRGWVPAWHGAWAMLIMPPAAGMILSGFKIPQLALLGFWWFGYFAFYPFTLFLKTRFRRCFLRPFAVYAAVCILCGAPLVFCFPRVLCAAAVFLPLILISCFCSWKRMERSLLNDSVTVLAACLILFVFYALGAHRSPLMWAVLAFCSFACYFLGTVGYVKTNIRNRNSLPWLAASVSFHLFSLILIVSLCSAARISPAVTAAHFLFWAVLLLRSAAVPLYGRRHGWLRPRVIGLTELAFCIVLFVLVLCGFCV